MNSTAADEWSELNRRYLAAALAWLRKRLEHHARHWHLPALTLPPSLPAPPEPLAQQEKQGFWQRRQSTTSSQPAGQAQGQAQGTAPTGVKGTTQGQAQGAAPTSVREITKPAEMSDIEKQDDRLPA